MKLLERHEIEGPECLRETAADRHEGLHGHHRVVAGRIADGRAGELRRHGVRNGFGGVRQQMPLALRKVIVRVDVRPADWLGRPHGLGPARGGRLHTTEPWKTPNLGRGLRGSSLCAASLCAAGELHKLSLDSAYAIRVVAERWTAVGLVGFIAVEDAARLVYGDRRLSGAKPGATARIEADRN